MCIPPLSQTPQCASYCVVKLRGVHHTAELPGVHPTAESRFPVCITPQSQAPRFQGVHHSAVSNCIPRSQNRFILRSQVIKTSTKTRRCASHRGVNLHGVHLTAESNCIPWSQNRNLQFFWAIFASRLRLQEVFEMRIGTRITVKNVKKVPVPI